MSREVALARSRTAERFCSGSFASSTNFRTAVGSLIVKEVNEDSLFIQENSRRDGKIRWQWDASETGEEESIWHDYSDADSEAIERAFQFGATHVRINAGAESEAQKLKELFLGDMVQYNAVTGGVRHIRRCGPDNIVSKLKRFILGSFISVLDGTPRHKSFIAYRKKLGQEVLQKTKKAKRSEVCHKIVASHGFLLMQMTAIVLNTVVIGLDVDYNGPEATDEARFAFTVMDHCFCILFTAEIIVRIFAMTKQRTYRKALSKILSDAWLRFDFFLVVVMVIETWVTPLVLLIMVSEENQSSDLKQLSIIRLLRLLRLSRVGRIARLLTFFPETLVMLRCILQATRAVTCTFGMLVVMLYIFAIIFTTRSREAAIEHIFPNITASMWKLLLHGAFMENVGVIVPPIYEEDEALAVLFVLFIFLSNLTVLNMLIGVICEVANDVSVKEREMVSAKRLKNDLGEFLSCFDMDNDYMIGTDEFDLLMRNPDVRLMLERHDIDYNILMTLKNNLFINKEAMVAAKEDARLKFLDDMDLQQRMEELPIIFKALPFDELIDVILRFRGGKGNLATMMDIIGVEENIVRYIEQLEKATVDQHLDARKSSRSSHQGIVNSRLSQCAVPQSIIDGSGFSEPIDSRHSTKPHHDVGRGEMQNASVKSNNIVLSQLVEIREQLSQMASRQSEAAENQARLEELVRGSIPSFNQATDKGVDEIPPGQALQSLNMSRKVSRSEVRSVQCQTIPLEFSRSENAVGGDSSSNSSNELRAAIEAQSHALQILSSQVSTSETAMEARMKVVTDMVLQQDAAMDARMRALTDAILQRLPEATKLML